MSVYGLKEYVDNEPATLVVAADTVDEFGTWYAGLQALEGDERLFVREELSQVMRHLVDPVYKGFKKPVHVVFHRDEAQRNEFFEQQKLVEQKSNPARDRQADMLHRLKEDIREATETDEDRNRTIEERLGIDVTDPHDRRSEEEVEADRAMKEEMKKQRAAGTVSSDSFADPDAIRAQRKADRLKDALAGKMSETMAREQLKEMLDPSDANYQDLDKMGADDLRRTLEEQEIEGVEVIADTDYETIRESIMGPADSGLHISDVKAVVNDDGSVNVESITAHKHGGEVDTDLQEQRDREFEERRQEKLAGRRSFGPEDFADVLRGDGRADAVKNVDADKPEIAHSAPVARPSLGDHIRAAEEAVREMSSPTKTTASTTREITLTAKQWAEIDARVSDGDYSDASEVIREAIRTSKK